MKDRIDMVVDPDISEFNVALLGRTRLSVFDNICPDRKHNIAKRNAEKILELKQR